MSILIGRYSSSTALAGMVLSQSVMAGGGIANQPLAINIHAPVCANRRYPVIPKIPLYEDRLIRIQADQANINKDDVSTFSGSVLINQGRVQLEADRASYVYRTDLLDAVGNIRFITPDAMFSGDSLHANLKKRQAQIERVVYFTREGGNGRANTIQMLDPQHMNLHKASYTTCPPEKKPDWSLSASKIRLNRETEVGTATNVLIKAKNVPFFYVPYLRFPLTDRRMTGLLFPSIGSSNLHGTEVRIPVYWNIAPNYDATFTPWYMSDRGTMLQTEFRYLHRKNRGQLDINYLNKDKKQDNETRDSLRWRHNGNPFKGWTTAVDYSRVSDIDYLKTFGNTLNTTSLTALNQLANAQYRTGKWSFSATVQDYQTISLVNTLPYKRLPQLQFGSHFPIRDNRLNYELKGEVVSFDHELDNKVTGNRLDVTPALSWPLRTPGAFLEPKLAWRFTQYQLENTLATDTSPYREVPTLSIDSGLIFDRNTGRGNNGFLHTLEPRLYYVFTPYRDQEALPIFDTQQTRFSVNEPIKADFFDGADRVEDANRLTAMLYTRLFSNDSGAEVFSAGLGQIYYFADRRVTLPGRAPDTSYYSNVIAELNTQPGRIWGMRSDLQWNPKESEIDIANVSMKFATRSAVSADLSYHYQRNVIETAGAGLRWQITTHWSIDGKQLFDVRNDRNLESRLGVRYDSCCWAIGLTARDRYINALVDNDRTLYLDFVFKGLSSISTGKRF